MIKFYLNDIEYNWEGNCNQNWFSQKGKTQKIGDVKFFKNKLFYVRYISDKNTYFAPVEKDYKPNENMNEPGFYRSDIIIDFTIRENWFKENILGK